ncbi:MAG TPA: Zn-ribbon domain-containing OB-fold protein [Syntrophomonadaceae bacterium]|nr:Zn-ribbon domain-containing OB-fold protein [Syntrophomonadaceae bacterium]
MDYKLTFKDYNKALKQDRLLGLKCNDCGMVTCPPMMVCGECASTNHEIVQLSGQGKIVSFTTSFIAAEGRENEVPYTIVMVELDEGPWIMGNLIDMDAKKTTMEVMGKPVQLSSRVFPGDKYSAGEAARPGFCFVK